MTWDFTVFEARGPARSAYACIPRDSLPGFVAALEEGALDDPIAAYLALTSRRRVLSAPGQTTRPGLYDQMGAPAGLLAPERDPQTGHQEPGVPGAKRGLARPGKRNGQEQEAPKKEQEAPRKAARFVPRAAAIGVAIAVVLAGAAVAVISRAQGGPSNPPGLVSFQPTALFFPADPVNTQHHQVRHRDGQRQFASDNHRGEHRRARPAGFLGPRPGPPRRCLPRWPGHRSSRATAAMPPARSARADLHNHGGLHPVGARVAHG